MIWDYFLKMKKMDDKKTYFCFARHFSKPEKIESQKNRIPKKSNPSIPENRISKIESLNPRKSNPSRIQIHHPEAINTSSRSCKYIIRKLKTASRSQITRFISCIPHNNHIMRDQSNRFTLLLINELSELHSGIVDKFDASDANAYTDSFKNKISSVIGTQKDRELTLCRDISLAASNMETVCEEFIIFLNQLMQDIESYKSFETSILSLDFEMISLREDRERCDTCKRALETKYDI